LKPLCSRVGHGSGHVVENVIYLVIALVDGSKYGKETVDPKKLLENVFLAPIT